MIEAINHRELEALDALVAEDFVRHCAATPDVRVTSREEFKEFLRRDFAAVPDSRMQILRILGEGDQVAVLVTYGGTQRGALGPFPASGESFQIPFLSILRLEDGKIAEAWIEWDNMSILGQLGHLPPPPEDVADGEANGTRSEPQESVEPAAVEAASGETDGQQATEPEHQEDREPSSPVQVLWHQAKALFPIRVHLPEDFDSTRTYPAVIALHGLGSSSERFHRIGDTFAAAGFIAALPEGPYPVASDQAARSSTWELSTWLPLLDLGPALTDDPAIERRSSDLTGFEFFPSVIDRIEEQYRVGPLYIFGFSLGGVYSLAGGFYNRDRFDGIVAFGVGGFDDDWFTRRGGELEDGNHLPIRLVQGRSDPLVPFSEAERARDLLQEAGYRVVLDGFDGGHAVPDDALQRAVRWLEELSAPH